MYARYSFLSLWVIFTLISINPCVAQPGTLDISYHGTGFRTDSIPLALFDHLSGKAVTTQPDRKILVSAMINGTLGPECSLYRYNEDGSLDQTFGNGGILELNYSVATGIQYLAVQTDGKIVGCGFGITEQQKYNWTIIRLNPDGSYDNTFGNGGIVLTHLSETTEVANCVRLLPGGEILASGLAFDSASNIVQYVIVRYKTDGSLDPAFGAGGIVRYPVPGGGDALIQGMISLQSDGKIVLCGNTKFGKRNTVTLARFSPDGTNDKTFGDNGLVIDSTGLQNGTYTLAIGPDDKIVVPGWVYINDLVSSEFSVLRYNADGARDKNFARDGQFVGPTGSAYDAVVQPDGKIIVAGRVMNDTVQRRPTVCRLLASGELDPWFGIVGFFSLNEVIPGNINAVTFDNMGRIIGTGYCQDKPTQEKRHLLTLRLNTYGLGVDPLSVEPSVQLFPNPVTDELVISLKESGTCDAILYAADGRQILRTQLTQETTILKVGSLAPGVYFISIHSPGKNQTMRMVKM
jgi:uncharacterized delta-60 repeat protein